LLYLQGISVAAMLPPTCWETKQHVYTQEQHNFRFKQFEKNSKGAVVVDDDADGIAAAGI
jgi:hypothetical protein